MKRLMIKFLIAKLYHRLIRDNFSRLLMSSLSIEYRRFFVVNTL